MVIFKKIMNTLFQGKHSKIFAKGTIISFVGLITVRCCMLLHFLVKTRVLTPAEVGLISLAISILAMTFVINNGFFQAILRYASFYEGKGSKSEVKGMVFLIYRLAIPILFILLVLVNIFAKYIAEAIFRHPQLTTLIRMVSLDAFFMSITTLNIALLRSRYLNKYEYIFITSGYVITITAILSLLFVKNLIVMFVAVSAIAAFIVMIFSFSVLRREIPFLFDSDTPISKPKERILHFAIFSSVAEFMVRFRVEINIFCIALFLSYSDVALFNVAFQLAFFSSIFLQASNSIFLPMVSNLHGRHDIARIRRIHKKISFVLVGFATGIFLIYIVGGKFILGLFGEYYKKAYIALQIITVASVVNSATGSVDYIINMLGRPYLNSINQVISLAIIIMLNYFLIPIYGLNGAAIAYACGSIFISLFALFQVLWLYKTEEKG